MRSKKDNSRRGPRALLKRGPQPARTAARRKPAPVLLEKKPLPPRKPGESAADPDRHLLNYRKHFREGTKNEANFRATRAIVTTARRWRKLANERVTAIGQSMARWEALFLVAFSDEELTQSELARLISIEGPTMVRMLDALAREGLIARRQSSIDRRVTTNRITGKGMRVIRDIMIITDRLRADVLGDIEPKRLAIFIDVLTEILRNIDERSAIDG